MKKRFLFILALGAVVALSTSCGKKCVCVYYENDKKIDRTDSSKNGQTFFKEGKDVCEGKREHQTEGYGNWINTEARSVFPWVTGKVKAEQKCKLQ